MFTTESKVLGMSFSVSDNIFQLLTKRHVKDGVSLYQNEIIAARLRFSARWVSIMLTGVINRQRTASASTFLEQCRKDDEFLIITSA
jgi:hypothetical protein